MSDRRRRMTTPSSSGGGGGGASPFLGFSPAAAGNNNNFLGVRAISPCASPQSFSSCSCGNSSITAHCSVCFDQPSAGELSLSCPSGHVIDSTCLAAQLRALPTLDGLTQRGLRCLGDSCRCEYRFSLAEIRLALQGEQLELLSQRLDPRTSPLHAGDDFQRRQVEWLSQELAEAFTLCCPREGCGAALDKVEGCNAASCSDERCRAAFCYLCLQPQEGTRANHEHTRQHSGTFWEHRPGYVERYHWLLARRRLAHVFRHRLDPATRARVLALQEPLLRERQMWPLPAGLMTPAWLDEVRQEASLSPEAKVALLQNESIYHRQQQQRGGSAASLSSSSLGLLDVEILTLGGKVVTSLDVGDANGDSRVVLAELAGGRELGPAPRPPTPPVPAPAPAAAGEQRIRNWVAAVAADAALPPEPHHEEEVEEEEAALQGMDHVFFPVGVLPVVAPDTLLAGRIPRKFASLGPMHQAAGLVWSAAAPQPMTFAQALRHARGVKARLPTVAEWRALARALGKDISRRRQYKRHNQE